MGWAVNRHEYLVLAYAVFIWASMMILSHFWWDDVGDKARELSNKVLDELGIKR